jgi:23S rRNA (cytidine2498-2'-O)-methyltransferase
VQNVNIYLAHKDFTNELVEELQNVREQHGRLIVADATNGQTVWAQDVWFEPEEIKFASINEAAKALKSIGKNWVLFSVACHRRAKLIQEKLPKYSGGRIEFPSGLPWCLPEGKHLAMTSTHNHHFGCWSLIDEHTIIASTHTHKNAPCGIYEFVEDKKFPPNRAYLKLWEVFTSLNIAPKKGEVCLDLGSSPGGWTWVLQQLGAHVISVDKAPLNPKIAKLSNIQFVQQSAFSLDPKHHEPVDWLFSDVICYPDRLYTFVKRWLDSGKCKNFVCTVKLQDRTNGTDTTDMTNRFRRIEGSKLLHLYHNKHEVTWVCRA